MKMTETMITII